MEEVNIDGSEKTETKDKTDTSTEISAAQEILSEENKQSPATAAVDVSINHTFPVINATQEILSEENEQISVTTAVDVSISHTLPVINATQEILSEHVNGSDSVPVTNVAEEILSKEITVSTEMAVQSCQEVEKDNLPNTILQYEETPTEIVTPEQPIVPSGKEKIQVLECVRIMPESKEDSVNISQAGDTCVMETHSSNTLDNLMSQNSDDVIVIPDEIAMDTTDDIEIVEPAQQREEVGQNSLSLLAQYDSDESDASVVEVNVDNKAYRNQVFPVDSDSDSDSSSSSSSDEKERGDYLRNIRQKLDDYAYEDESDDDDDNKDKKKSSMKVKGELSIDELPPIADLHITVPEDECKELGRVQSIVGELVLVSVLPNSLLLDLDTVLFLEKGKRVLGQVFDVLGQVSDPLYCIRFNSNDQIKEKNINVDDVVYVAPKTEHTQFIILSSITQNRGSDASWENDIEPPQHCLDYSDDEQERAAKSKNRNKNRTAGDNKNEKKFSKRVCTNEDNIPTTSQARPVQSYSTRNFQTNTRNFGPRPESFHNSHNSYRGTYRPNYNQGSWHSNYYPSSYNSGPPSNMFPYNPNIPPPPPIFNRPPMFREQPPYGMRGYGYSQNLMQPPMQLQRPPIYDTRPRPPRYESYDSNSTSPTPPPPGI